MRLLKFDTAHPQDWVPLAQRSEPPRFQEMSRSQYLDRLMAQRINYSDFYTFHLRNCGWAAEEFVTNSDVLLAKTEREVFGGIGPLLHLCNRATNRAVCSLGYRAVSWKERVISAYVRRFKPDVILVREDCQLPSRFWARFRQESLVVCRLACGMPWEWSARDYDFILTSVPAFRDFFEANGVPSLVTPNGFDERVAAEVAGERKEHDVVFIGGLGPHQMKERTERMEKIAERTPFKWWGYWEGKDKPTGALARTWQGSVAGLDMYRVIRQSRVVLNDYIDLAKGHASNQRLFETMGTGSLLLTRFAPNLEGDFPPDIFVTFDSVEDACAKIDHLLKNESEREAIAARGQRFVLEKFNYKDLMRDLSRILQERWNARFGGKQ
jgi:hypothetical protein